MIFWGFYSVLFTSAANSCCAVIVFKCLVYILLEPQVKKLRAINNFAAVMECNQTLLASDVNHSVQQVFAEHRLTNIVKQQGHSSIKIPAAKIVQRFCNILHFQNKK